MTDYKVIGFDEASGSMVISFSDTMPPLAVDVPLDADGKYVTGAELDAYVRGFIPTWHLERVEKIRHGIPNAAEIKALVQPIVGADQNADPVSEQPVDQQLEVSMRMWTEQQELAKLSNMLIKLGVLAQDPTKIETTQL